MTATDLWYFRPDTDMTEILEWSTEVLRCRAATQRIARRQYPRITLRHKYVMTRADARRAELLARNRAKVLVPLWQDGARVYTEPFGDYVEIGASSFHQITNCGKRFAVGKQLAILGDGGTYELLKIDFISWINSFAHISTETPATQAHVHALIAPIIEATVDFRVTRVSGDYALARAELVSTWPMDYIVPNFPDAVIATYRDAYLMTVRPLADLDSEVGQTWHEIDGGNGLIERLPAYAIQHSAETVRWYLDRWDTVGRGRWWLYQMQGMRRQFWLPTFNHDFQPVAAGALSGTTLTVIDCGYAAVFDPDMPGGSHLAIYGDDGLWYPREITAVAAGTPGVSEVVTVSGALPAVIPEMICQLRAVRMASDKVEWRYGDMGFGYHWSDPLIGTAVLSMSVTEEVANEYVEA